MLRDGEMIILITCFIQLCALSSLAALGKWVLMVIVENMVHDQENEISYNIFAYPYIKKLMIS